MMRPMKNSINLKTMFTLFLTAPFLVLIVMIFIFMGLAETRNTQTGTIQAPKYLIKPLQDIIENDYRYSEEAEGVLMLLDCNGDVLYPAGSDDLFSMNTDISSLYREMFNNGPDNISMTKYNYNGEPGFCFFDNSYVPAVYKQQIRVGISIFIVIISCMGMIFGQFSTVIINSSIKKLVDASDLIANGNLDEKISLEYNNEFVHVANAIDRMRVELREKRNIEQRFVMSVTHDLKTPLTSINGYLEAIADGIIIDPDEVKEIIELMQKKTGLLDNRINELLDYSKNRTAGWRDHWSEIPLLSWLDDLSSMFKNDAELYSRKYLSHINVSTDLTMKGNDKLLTRALENLFDNACRYTESGDLIIFSAVQSSRGGRETLDLSLEDSGSGINDEDRDKIFELFYRNDRGRNSRGMGIGLASVRTIIEDHGGTVSCGSSSSGGAKFSLILPI